MERIDTKRCRDNLLPRREPYWYKLSRDRHIGLRKLTSRSKGSWIARFRDDTGKRVYKSLGECSETFDFDAAKGIAEAWFKDQQLGVRELDNERGRATVENACRDYVVALQSAGRGDAAHDAHMRFRRTVYGRAADVEFGPKSRQAGHAAGSTIVSTLPAPKTRLVRKWDTSGHEIAGVRLSKLLGSRLRAWHTGLVTKGLSKSAANRTLTSLKAALNLAVENRKASAELAQEWSYVQPLKGAGRRRELFLDVVQRRALLASADGAIRNLLEAVMHTGCRAGELTSAKRSAFDSRTRSLSVTGKTGSRTIPLTDRAVTFFSTFAEGKEPSSILLTRDDGKPWGHSDWDERVKEAAKKAELPANTCLYTLRHSFITQALLDGVSTLEISKIVGTSLVMIEKHYGHLVYDTARDRLSRVQLV